MSEPITIVRKSSHLLYFFASSVKFDRLIRELQKRFMLAVLVLDSFHSFLSGTYIDECTKHY